MTKKTRYFLVGSGVLLLVGIGGGLVAYYGYNRAAGIPAGLPTELRYVPASAELVAYADVQAVMNSELRRELERMTLGPKRGRDDISRFAGIDLEKQVHHIVAYLEKMDASIPVAQTGPPRGLMLVQGSFEQVRVEQFIREHGGTIEDYHGKHLAALRPDAPAGTDNADRQTQRPEPDMAVGFVEPTLIALGHTDLVRQVLDVPAGGAFTAAASVPNVTSNADLMNLVRDASGDTAWVVGHFDAVSRRMGVPNAVRTQVPPLRLVAAKARINGGVKATIRAETADQAAADQMRDVVRGFVSLIRLQAGAKPELQDALKSIELGGTGTTVQLSFAMTPETFKAIIPQPQRGQRPDRQMPETPVPPAVPPAPPTPSAPPSRR